MPGKFPEEETPYEVVLVYQLVDAIFDISQSPDVPRVRVWKYYRKRLNGAKQVRNFIKKLISNTHELTDDDMSRIFEIISRKLKPAYVKQFESKDNLPLKIEFVKRLRKIEMNKRLRV